VVVGSHSMDGQGWILPTFHPLALGPPTTFRRFAANQSPGKILLPKAQDESHAFVNHTSPRARSPPPSPSRRVRPSTSTTQLDMRRHTSMMSSAGASSLRFQPSASAPALHHGTPGRRPTPGHRTRVALQPQPSPSRTAKQPGTLDPSRCSTVGPNLAYTNYMALSTPLVRRWVRTPRGPAHVPPAKPGYYAAHEIWPSSHHAPGVQHHLRPIRSTSPESHRSRTGGTAQERSDLNDFGDRIEFGGSRTAVGFGGKSWGQAIGLEVLEARGEVSEGAQALDSMVRHKPAEMIARIVPGTLPRFPLPSNGSRGRSRTASTTQPQQHVDDAKPTTPSTGWEVSTPIPKPPPKPSPFARRLGLADLEADQVEE